MENFIQFLSYISLCTPIINAYDVEKSRFQRISVEQIEKFRTSEIFYIVNSGGARDSDINKYNAFFVDFDCPKAQNGTYATLVEVKKFKDEILEKINSFKLMPTFIIDTRNGYHVYWCLEKSSNIKREEWQIIEDYLIKFLDADPKVNNPARNMRLPFTYWNKDKNNPYYVSIHTFNDVRYSTKDFKEVLNIDLVTEKAVTNEKTSIKSDMYFNENIEAIKNLNVESMKKILQDKKTLGLSRKTYTLEELYSEINFNTFIGINSNMFKCILPEHEDNSPSAKIYVTDNKIQLYKCFGCGKVLTLPQLIQKLSNCSHLRALEFLSNVYDIRIFELEKMHCYIDMLEKNISLIESEDLKRNFPNIFVLIKKRIPHLVEILRLAQKNVNSFSSKDNLPIFWFSYSDILRFSKLFSSKNMISQTLTLSCLLDIITKLDDSEIPALLLEKAYEISHRYKLYNRCNFYLVKPLTDEALKKVEETAKILNENNITLGSLSMEFVLRTFSKEKVEEIYPQHGEEYTISERANYLTDEIVKKIFEKITSDGFVFLEEVRIYKQWKKSINEILNSYDLSKVKLNKKLKEKFGISCKGYPFIICSNNMLEDGENENG